MDFKKWISNLHYQQGKWVSPWLWPLLPLSWGYGIGVALRLMAYGCEVLKTTPSPAPIISVGNLTTGGTGKTPLVIEIARGLIQSGKTVVILSRGYGAAEPVPYVRALGPQYGDEAYLIQAQVPEAIVIVGRDRVYTLEKALQDYRPDFVLLDDGFQYLPLHRHLNILLIDGSRLFGNGHLLPTGPLREPLSGLRRADLVFVTKHVDTQVMERVEKLIAEYGSKPRPMVFPVPFQPIAFKPMQLGQETLLPQSIQGHAIIAFSGIAQPLQFEEDLKQLGAKIIKHVAFSDHHIYTAKDIQPLLDLMESHRGNHPTEHPLLVTTEKDLGKIKAFIPTAWQPFVYTLQIKPALDGHWFYSEILTQMIQPKQTGAIHAH